MKQITVHIKDIEFLLQEDLQSGFRAWYICKYRKKMVVFLIYNLNLYELDADKLCVKTGKYYPDHYPKSFQGGRTAYLHKNGFINDFYIGFKIIEPIEELEYRLKIIGKLFKTKKGNT
jgi:hypothetical protein